ncbi:MAG: hypothetical protein ACOCP4_06545, partial [Candidatus Woesearchaeota archaeon]
MNTLQKIKDDLSEHYQKSYKFVVYKAFIDLQKNGTVVEKDVIEYIRKFYERRKRNNKKIETDNAKIWNLLSPDNFDRLQKYIEDTPLNYLDTLSKKEIIEIDKELWEQLDDTDIRELYNFIENKLEEYYKTKVGDEY